MEFRKINRPVSKSRQVLLNICGDVIINMVGTWRNRYLMADNTIHKLSLLEDQTTVFKNCFISQSTSSMYSGFFYSVSTK